MFGNHPVPVQGAESRTPPPAFASEPLMHASGAVDKNAVSTARPGNLDILEVDGYGSGTSSLPNLEGDFLKNTSPTGVRNFLNLVFGCFCSSLPFYVLCGPYPCMMYWLVISHILFFAAWCNHQEECRASGQTKLGGPILC